MARVAVALSCTAEVASELERLSRSRSGEVRLAERARIVLACLQGKRNDEVAREVGVRPNTVGLWRQRFSARGLQGLRDEPRTGKPAKYGAALRVRVLEQLELSPPAGMASWDGGSLAVTLGVSDDAVWRVLRKEGIQLQRHRSWCVSTDPEFAAKAADVIGLYLNPPQNALVLSVDEKPSIQALERARGMVRNLPAQDAAQRQHRSTHRGNPRFHRCLQRECHPPRLAQARGEGLAASQHYR